MDDLDSSSLIEDYYKIREIKEIIIFSEWLLEDSQLKDWAISQLSNYRWKQTVECNNKKVWFRLSK